jgi:Nucleotidyl transferase AbiEii toxin, Type IV TA system
MFDLYEELSELIAALDEDGVEYALCGGLAMAVHGYPRATVDIDLLVVDGDRAIDSVRRCGFDIPARPMIFADGDVVIRRASKIEGTQLLSVDFLVVTPRVRTIWEQRKRFVLRGANISVLGRAALAELKSLRNSPQDVADIAHLREEE